MTVYQVYLSDNNTSGEIWEDDNDEQDIDEDILDPCSVTFNGIPENPQITALTQWLICFLIRFQSKYYIPDAAIDALLKFLYTLFLVIGRFSSNVAGITRILPKTLYSMRNVVGYNDSFQRYVVCPRCHKLYDIPNCISRCGSIESTRNCSFVKHPNHPYRSGRAPCSAPLMRSVTLRTGKIRLYPFKIILL